MSIYMKIAGIQGDVTLKSKEAGWIEIYNLQFGVTKNATNGPGKTPCTQPQLSEVILTKHADSATPRLFQKSCEGETFDEVCIHACKDSKPYMEYIFSDVIITQYQNGVQALDSTAAVIENISFIFKKIEIRFNGHDETAKLKAAVTTGYDLATLKTF